MNDMGNPVSGLSDKPPVIIPIEPFVSREYAEAEGDKLWAEKIIEVCGNIKLEWRYRDNTYDCVLDVDGGIEFKHK